MSKSRLALVTFKKSNQLVYFVPKIAIGDLEAMVLASFKASAILNTCMLTSTYIQAILQFTE